MKITKTQLRKIIKEELKEARGANFAMGEEMLNFLYTQFSVKEEEAVSFLRKMADRLEMQK
tara:strand:+ start:905 stop:1087 length:183 start_codon:yes stop_codon:yes gene_type:complete